MAGRLLMTIAPVHGEAAFPVASFSLRHAWNLHGSGAARVQSEASWTFPVMPR
jgi:hypothetical protein